VADGLDYGAFGRLEVIKIICIWFIHDMGVIEKENSVHVITLF
jgi:hypothetical protein